MPHDLIPTPELDGRRASDLLDGATELLDGAVRLRAVAERGTLGEAEIAPAIIVILAALTSLGAAVEGFRRGLADGGDPEPCPNVERRMNELASAVHAARHSAALVCRSFGADRQPIRPADPPAPRPDPVDAYGAASFPASDPPGWWAGP